MKLLPIPLVTDLGGIDRIAGLDRIDRIDGIDGIDGIAGLDGIDGIAGLDGIDRIDGIDSLDGLAETPLWWRLTWTCGPDAGRTAHVAPGRHLVGRSPLATVRCADPGLEPFHLELDLPAVADVAPTWCQLAGRRPVVDEGSGNLVIGTSILSVCPVSGRKRSDDLTGSHSDDHVAERFIAARFVTERFVAGGSVVRQARLRLGERPTDHHASTGEDLDGREDLDELDRIDRFAPDESHVAVVPALATLLIGIAIAVAVHQPMFAVMGAVGAAVAVSTWVVGRLRRRRRERRRARDHATMSARRADEIERRRRRLCVIRRVAQPGLVGAVAAAHCAPAALWQRRPAHGDAFTVVLGIGTVRVCPDPRAPALVLDRVPITIDLAAAARVAITGPNNMAGVRALIVQLAVTTGPADWELLVVSTYPQRWLWAAGLPHVRLTSAGAVAHDAVAVAEVLAEPLLDRGGDGFGEPGGDAVGETRGGVVASHDARHLLVVTDEVDEVAVRTSGLRRLLHQRPDAGLLACVPADREVPAMCSTVAVTTADGGMRLDHHGRPASDVVVDSIGGAAAAAGGRFRLTGLGEETATALARSLARWTDPEAPADRTRALPGDVRLESLLVSAFGTDRAGIVAGWRSLGADARPCAPLGVGVEGVVDIDLVRDGPHALVAGTTGSGKSELLRTLIASLAVCVPPDQLAFVLVDFKGGATFDDLTALPHVVGVVTDLEPRLAERVLRSLRAEVTAREQLLRRHGCSDLTSARERLGAPVMPRLVIVVDEFAALAMEHPHLLHSLVDVARRGRSLGIHLVLATQRPSGVVSEEIRTNTDLRIALRLQEASEAIDVVGDAGPASIRRSAAGRAVVRLGPGERIAIQSARVRSVGRLVEEIVAAADAYGAGLPSRPWCDPLPLTLDPARLEPSTAEVATGHAAEDGRGDDSVEFEGGSSVALGIIDRPDAQRQDVLVWRPSDGHVLVVGSPGSGVTTTLASIAVRSLERGGSSPELLVIDAMGDGRWDDVARLARCAGVVRLNEHERLERACARALKPPPVGGRVVAIDGIGALRRDVEAPSRSAVHDHIEALLLDTPPGVTLLLGNEGVSGLGPAVVARCARRWILHLHEPNEGAAFGVRAAAMPPAIPGRMVDASDGSEAQLVGWPTVIQPEANSTSLIGESCGPSRPSERVERIEVLPDRVPARELPMSCFDGRVWRPVLGISHRSLEPVSLDVPTGEHLLIVGPARSGRSEVLTHIRRCWSDARPDAAQVVLAPRRLPPGEVATATAEAIDQVERDLDERRPVLLVVDDAELVADVGARLMAMIARRPNDLTVVASCRSDAVRGSYGQWLGELRRSRRGVVMASGSDLDGDVLGVVLPRHPPVLPRPGLCWLVADGNAVAAQAAVSC